MNLDWYYTFLVLSKHLNYHRGANTSPANKKTRKTLASKFI